jgi:LacI family transcriptional regulator
VVTVNRKVDDPAVSSVTNDEARGVLLAVEHMISLGHRGIAAIAGPRTLSTGAERYTAFLSAIEQAGLDAGPAFIASSTAYNEAEGFRACRELLECDRSFTAIVCANDRLAIGAIEAIHAAGLDCPGDISVSGHNDMPFADRISPPLTTISIKKREAGAEAAAVLIYQMGKPPEKRDAVHRVLPVELIVRSSTAPPPR